MTNNRVTGVNCGNCGHCKLYARPSLKDYRCHGCGSVYTDLSKFTREFNFNNVFKICICEYCGVKFKSVRADSSVCYKCTLTKHKPSRSKKK